MSDSDPDSDAAAPAAPGAGAAPRLPPNARGKLRDLLQHLTAVGAFAGRGFVTLVHFSAQPKPLWLVEPLCVQFVTCCDPSIL